MLEHRTSCKLCGSPTAVRYAFSRYDLLECRDCGFRFIPYLDNEAVEPRAPSEERLRRERAYAEQNLEGNKERLAALVGLARKHARPGGLVLDVGCGAGHFLRAMNDRPTVGIELSPVWYTISKERGVNVHPHALAHSFWDAYRGRIAAITLWDVIEHVNDPVGIFARAHDLLEPGGRLLADTPSADGLLYRFGDLTARLSRGAWPTTLGVQYRPTPYDHKQIFRKRDMRNALARAGFDRVKIETKTELSLSTEFYLSALKLPQWLAPVVGPAVRSFPLRNKMIVVAEKH